MSNEETLRMTRQQVVYQRIYFVWLWITMAMSTVMVIQLPHWFMGAFMLTASVVFWLVLWSTYNDMVETVYDTSYPHDLTKWSLFAGMWSLFVWWYVHPQRIRQLDNYVKYLQDTYIGEESSVGYVQLHE